MKHKRKRRHTEDVADGTHEDIMCQGCHTITENLTGGYCQECADTYGTADAWYEIKDGKFQKV